MHEENRDQVQNRRPPDPRLVGLLMGVVALVAPYGFRYHPDINFPEVNFYAVMWGLSVGVIRWYFLLPPYLDILQFPPGTLFYLIIILLYLFGIRILFAYQIVRYFQGKTTRKRLITVGVLAEFPMAVATIGDILLFIILIINRTTTYLSFWYLIPTPVMLLLGFLLLRFFPAQGESDWDLKREDKKWWPETSSDSVKV